MLLLRCLLGITPRRLHEVAWRSGCASGAIRAIRAGEAGSDRDRAFLEGSDPVEIRRRLAEGGARFVPPGDPEYWPAFVRLADPPIGLFARGAPLGMGQTRASIVGSRRPTAVGREVAMSLARGLASSGVVVVSGAAIGIDSAAHRGSLDAGGMTVAVLGSGIDVAYPPSSRGLLGEVESSGTILSEYPPGVPAEPHRFPARNRLIVALASAVVIVEATAKSGTRSTAEHAMDLGIDVYAVPGPVTSPLSETPLQLIRDGATMIRDAEDLLADLGLGDVVGSGAPLNLTGVEAAAYEVLTESMLPERVASSASMDLAVAIAALMSLELRGLVRGSGGRFERTFLGRGDGRRT